MATLEPAAAACLERTRSHVLNTLVCIGIGIAASGLALRAHAQPLAAHTLLRRGLTGGLLAIVVASYLSRRILARRVSLSNPAQRAQRFYRAHLVSAGIGALAIPLGLVYGWVIRPRLEEVLPFWVAALALGFLALPRTAELQDFDTPMPDPSEPRV
jgi:hypothetical protein